MRVRMSTWPRLHMKYSCGRRPQACQAPQALDGPLATPQPPGPLEVVAQHTTVPHEQRVCASPRADAPRACARTQAPRRRPWRTPSQFWRHSATGWKSSGKQRSATTTHGGRSATRRARGKTGARASCLDAGAVGDTGDVLVQNARAGLTHAAKGSTTDFQTIQGLSDYPVSQS